MVGTVEAVTAHVWQLEYNLGTHFSYKYGSSRCIEHADKWLCIFSLIFYVFPFSEKFFFPFFRGSFKSESLFSAVLLAVPFFFFPHSLCVVSLLISDRENLEFVPFETVLFVFTADCAVGERATC
ncbi:hypothetical protein MANES_14G046651v8 [Manihot esculenta]|uniref:Uncharacterized protein n=1 Tax=Manihot esculenta TaxID=3983 RepID=A0ACB7GF18_MANES|nr:hypothetical protein MANES_14G046651v8 [Manihot esculenta]